MKSLPACTGIVTATTAKPSLDPASRYGGDAGYKAIGLESDWKIALDLVYIDYLEDGLTYDQDEVTA